MTDTDQSPRCGNCMFWERGYGGDRGVRGSNTDGSVSHCRIRAPVRVDPERTPGENRQFPQTRIDDWCGEHKWDVPPPQEIIVLARPSKPPSWLLRFWRHLQEPW